MNSIQTLFITFITLVNYAPDNFVLYGEPVILTADISFNDYYADVYFDIEKENLQKQLADSVITKDEYDQCIKEMEEIRTGISGYTIENNWKEKVKLEMYADTSKSWIPYPWKVHFLGVSPDENPIKINSGSIVRFELGIDPEDVKTIPIGKYKMRFTAEVQKRDERYILISEEGIMKITGESADQFSYNVKHDLITYYIKRGLFEKARIIAEQLIEEDDSKLGGLTLMGNIYTAMGDYDNALEYLFEAEEEFDKQGFPEEDKLYIIDQIMYIQSIKTE
jgi:tetratricopeptide (TPR) repeat protein